MFFPPYSLYQSILQPPGSPFFKGNFCQHHPQTSLNKIKIPMQFNYPQNKPGNHDIIKGFILALFIHVVLFFIGGRLFVKPVQYGVQSANGGIDVDLVSPLSKSETDADKSTISAMEKQTETVKLPKSDADTVKPIIPAAENQPEVVKSITQEKPATLPQPERDAIKSTEPTSEKRRETTQPLQRPSQGTVRTKSNPAYFHNQPPEYPQRARQMHQEGLVLLRVDIDQKGMPVKVEVEQSSGYQLLDQAALKAVRNWRFQPGQAGNLPVQSRVIIPIRFRLE